ncbi:hypothetical protein B0T18DRAFT_401171 [Schizothecium vesticola]|uniref:Uncharacterized protein n=1 Tax=Schizothecium vesticola TaxID=314040 RepID=A0AA40F4P6_9PEZI|nr:hypothetical protein B0T18DRAFT_401171 [Schizothecium vesticola]
MGRKAGPHVAVGKPSAKRERSPAPNTHSCQFLEIDDSHQRVRKTTRSASPKDLSRTGPLDQRDMVCSPADPQIRRNADRPPPGRASLAWDDIPILSSTAGSTCSSDSDAVQQSTDSDSDSLVIVTNSGGSHRQQRTRKCPFYIRDPHRHQRCARVDLSPGHLFTDHLFQWHLHLPVCWRCGKMFKYVAQRNAHVVLGECELVEPLPTFEGVSEGTLYELEALISSWDRDVLQMSDEEKHARIWELVFPRESLHSVSSTRER